MSLTSASALNVSHFDEEIWFDEKIWIGVIGSLAVLAVVMLVWARSILSDGRLRATMTTQLSDALGQPVSIAEVETDVFPRVRVSLRDVSIGEPARVPTST